MIPSPPSPLLTPAAVCNGRGIGWRAPALPRRGVRYAAPSDGGWVHTPTDLRPVCPAPRDQSYRGACTGFAWQGLVDYLAARDVRDGLRRGPPFEASPHWIYLRERVMAGTTFEDVGASLIDGLFVVRDEGIGSEADMPYDPARFDYFPSARAVDAAKRVRVANASLLSPDADTLLATLASGFPFVFGTAWFDSYQDADQTGDFELPPDDALLVGGHALLACGFYRTRGGRYRVHVLNSWGRSWGANGFGTMPLEVLTDPGLTGERIVARALRFV